MSQTLRLLEKYRQQLALPSGAYLSATERVWMAVYDPEEERRVRAHLREFELATLQADLEWRQLDLTSLFSGWMAEHRYRDMYFQEPELLPGVLGSFEETLLTFMRGGMEDLTPQSVVAVTGAGSLFGLTRISRLVEGVAPALPGRMLLFFPGVLEGHNYRLLNARDGWNYHSVPLIP